MNFSDIPEQVIRKIQYKDEILNAWWNGVLHPFNPSLWVTFNFNRPTTIEGAQRLIRRWHDFTDRKFIGHRYADLPMRRTAGAVVFEHLLTNLHGHGALRPAIHAGARSSEEVFDLYRNEWKKRVPSGELNIRHAVYETRSEMLNYMKKECRRPGFFEDILLL